MTIVSHKADDGPNPNEPEESDKKDGRFDFARFSTFSLPRQGFAVWDWDLRNDVWRWSPEWERILADSGRDWSDGDGNRRWWSRRIHREDMPHVKKRHYELLSGVKNTCEVDFRLQRGDGSWIRLLSKNTVLARERDGKPAYILGIVMDITHLHDDEAPARGAPALPRAAAPDSEQRACLSEQRLSALNSLIQMENASENEVLHFVLNSMHQMTGSCFSFIFIPEDGGDGKGHFLWSWGWERSGVAMRGERLPDELQAFLPSLTDPGLSLMDNGDGSTPLMISPRGPMRIMRHIITCRMEGERVACLAGVCNKPEDYDASDLRQIEMFINGAWLILQRRFHAHALRQAKEAAAAARGAMTDFLSNVNHELRTPLTSILGYAETMVGLKNEDVALRERCLEVIQRRVAQVHDLIKDLLSLSRMECGSSLDMRPVPLDELVDEAAGLMRPQLGEKGQFLENAVSSVMQVRANKQLLSQVFYNLLENAARYAPANTGIHVSAKEEGGFVLVRVRDHGPGVPGDEIDMIFERFYTGKQSAGRHNSGIGLSICRHIIHLHGGRIWAENVDPGLAVCFALPDAMSFN